MRREQLTEKILDIKRSNGWSWKHVTEEIGVSPILVVGALLGQMKLVKPLAKKAAMLFGLSEDEERMLNEVPNRGTSMPPTDPLLYRFYELIMINGPALKASSKRSSAMGSCRQSISTWRWSVNPIPRVTA